MSADLTLDRMFRLSLERYEAMMSASVLTESDHVELIRGHLVKKEGKDQAHILAMGLLVDWLYSIVPQGWFVSTENPVVIADSMPEPDVILVRGQRRDFGNRRFTPDTLELVVEVSDSSLEIDRNVKLSLYAEAGIPLYWIVNLRDHRVEVYTQPQRDTKPAYYAALQIYGPAVRLPLTLDGAEIATIAAGGSSALKDRTQQGVGTAFLPSGAANAKNRFLTPLLDTRRRVGTRRASSVEESTGAIRSP
ncbi:MAG: Uma2 family endonuclease [Chloroflexi bacterium]|nr:Uma2 family endonuclease [Chloroflexota bacterium]